MRKNWVSQVVGSLGFKAVCNRKCFMRSWYKSKKF